MYGSSLRIETEIPRLLSSRPMLAAVMPLPSEEVTPPVTKTYFAIGSVLRGFFKCYRKRRTKRGGTPQVVRFARSSAEGGCGGKAIQATDETRRYAAGRPLRAQQRRRRLRRESNPSDGRNAAVRRRSSASRAAAPK